jgi:hypothetical protein
VDSFCPEFAPGMPVETLRRLLPLPPRPQPDGWWRWPNVQEAQRQLASEFIAHIPPFPGKCAGRGIVIVGGGKYAASAYVTVRVLRHVGCRLPIQLWHLAGEMDAGMRRLLACFDVSCVDADEEAWRRPYRFLDGHWWKGWQLKPYAILRCPFREVLLLDADCYPTRDPEYLFSWPGYRTCGAVFWADSEVGRSLFTPQLIQTFGVEPDGTLPIESGQILIDKERCWRELNLALHYNAQADYTYRLLHGDKDTFPLAWKRLGRGFASPWPICDWDTHTILQYDGEGRVLFQHRAQDKFTLAPTDFPSTYQLYPGNHYHPRLVHEEFCFQVLDELRVNWLSWWHELVRLWHPEDPYRPTEEFRRHYQVKYDLALRLRPRRIAEIGVRAGYAAFAFLSAVGEACYLGLDADLPIHGGIPGFFSYARTVLAEFDATLLHMDTRRMEALPGRFDLVHVDGDHSYAGCLHDLGLAARAANHVLVDDYDSLAEVRQACRTFLVEHHDISAEYIDDGLRGNLLLTVQQNRLCHDMRKLNIGDDQR